MLLVWEEHSFALKESKVGKEEKKFRGNTIMPEMAKTKQQLTFLHLARVKAKLFCYGRSLVGGIGG